MAKQQGNEMSQPSNEEVEAAVTAMVYVNEHSKGLLFSVLMKHMAIAAIQAAALVRDADEGTRPGRHPDWRSGSVSG